ncbi:MAG TPA: Holliday junction branch migration protein RuvA [Thermoanaerobaculia bacterium]|jgi:Holliday junction DNA helicase RuvA
MIGRLTGRLASRAPDQVLLDVGGVGYLIHIPLSTFYELPEQENPASLWIHTHVREDALALYGFLTERERSLFLLLLGVTGIGPRVALTVLSGIPPAELVDALCKQDVRRLIAIPGVGKKTAERMVLELAEKVANLPGEAPTAGPKKVAADDVISALVNLGYRKSEAERVVDAISRDGGPTEFGEFLRQALKRLTGG